MFGLMLFGLGEGLLIVSFTGASPWSVLAQGISLKVNLSIGTITLLISIAVLILWIPLGQNRNGDNFNALIIALMIDLALICPNTIKLYKPISFSSHISNYSRYWWWYIFSF